MLQLTRLAPSGKGMIHPEGHPVGFQAHNIPHLFENLAQYLEALGPNNRENIFYTLAHHGSLGGPYPSRSAATFEYQTVLPFDIDHVDAARAFEYLQIVAAVLKVPPQDLVLISTGGGLHVLAHLKKPFRSVKILKDLKPAYNEVVHKISQELTQGGLPGKVDPVVFDAARVFRLPGTINKKPGQPDGECVLLQTSKTPLDINLEEISGLARLRVENVTPDQIKRQYPKPDFEEIFKECRFLRWTVEHTDEVHEPHVFDLFSLLAAQPPGVKVSVQDQEMTALEVAEHVFKNASSSKSLARQDFTAKWEASSRYGARKCSTIAQNHPDACKTCPHLAKIPTPLALKSPDHVSSEDVGYWVLGDKGSPSHPHYSDLTKIYSRERKFVVTPEPRIFAFKDGLFREVSEHPIKAWLERRVNPSDPLRDRHCTEFLKKVQRVGAITDEEEDYLFNQSTYGKLNCKNGILDIRTGELLPHSSNYGFLYILPYDYTPDEGSDFFLDWLEEVSCKREEIMEALLDVMAYALWPGYEDHIFTYFVGEGANGKSTLLHLMQEIVGRDNFSSVSIQQLGCNRFAPAQLEGKLVNLSEESSGFEMSLEEMNVIKNLSAGGDMLVERKGQQGFMFKNKAKLIFSANQPPRFREKGMAIRRRMLVLPFDHEITKPDPLVEKRLIEEVPKIVSMLVRRIQENLKQNNGSFKVYRGGVSAERAQERILMMGESTIEWATESLDVSTTYTDSWISVTEAYAHYTQWCAQNGYTKPSNKNQFSATMRRFVLLGEDADNRVYLSNDRRMRVFKYMKWKEKEL